jgi:hypothetical protein
MQKLKRAEIMCCRTSVDIIRNYLSEFHESNEKSLVMGLITDGVHFHRAVLMYYEKVQVSWHAFMDTV